MEEIETFTLAPDGKSITCKRCHRTSYSLMDVGHLFCGYCRVSHFDIPVDQREDFIAGKPLAMVTC